MNFMQKHVKPARADCRAQMNEGDTRWKHAVSASTLVGDYRPGLSRSPTRVAWAEAIFHCPFLRTETRTERMR